MAENQEPLHFWGAPTATIDWCEENYVVTPYIAEYWNTISNIFLILPGAVAGLQAYVYGFERRYWMVYLVLLFVGIGSWLFHMTLLYHMQLLDEIPMVWGCLFILYALSEVHAPVRVNNWTLSAVFVMFGLAYTAIYVATKYVLFHQVFYALLVVVTFSRSIIVIRKYKCKPTLLVLASLCFLFGFILWNIDNFYCQTLRRVRRDVLASPLAPVTQLHAIWHVLTGLGTYFHCLFCCEARKTILARDFGVFMKSLLPLNVIRTNAEHVDQNGKANLQSRSGRQYQLRKSR